MQLTNEQVSQITRDLIAKQAVEIEALRSMLEATIARAEAAEEAKKSKNGRKK